MRTSTRTTKLPHPGSGFPPEWCGGATCPSGGPNRACRLTPKMRKLGNVVGQTANVGAAESLAASKPAVFWLDDSAKPDPHPALVGNITADLAVVGGGYSGLWTALRAKERDPGREVVVLEGREVGWAASGRNGGFVAASLTHGYSNGLSRFADEMDELERLGLQNLDGIGETVERYNLKAEYERTGELSVAVKDWQVGALVEEARERSHQPGVEYLDVAATNARITSPTYRAGLYDKNGYALVHPGKLAWELKRACLDLGVRFFERTKIEELQRDGHRMVLRSELGEVRATQVALGTNVFPSLVRRLRYYTVPVYDYVLMTEPLSDEQLSSIGWEGREAVMDAGNQFHYYRLTADNRILWGGYDAIYFFGRQIRDEHDQRWESHVKLAQHFFETFPQLEGLRFSHRWGGAIDTCSRFCAFFGTTHGGRVAHAAGFTGLGVGATRFGADVMLDLLDGNRTERTELEMVKSTPLPFPPEPLSYIGIQATRAAIAGADRNGGQRNLWLRSLDKFGLGFDS